MSFVHGSLKFKYARAFGLGIVLAVFAIIPPPVRGQSVPARITLDQAVDLALKHNHSLQALRTTILQNQAQELRRIYGRIRRSTVTRSSCQSSIPVTSRQPIWTTARSSIWASAICSSAGGNASIGFWRPRTPRRSRRHRWRTPNAA